MTVPLGLKALVADWLLARTLQRRTVRRGNQWLIERKADGSLWCAGSPQNLAYAMRSLFVRGRSDWHFYRVRIWQGMPVASRKTFWLPASGLEFRLIKRLTVFELEPWPVLVECRKLDRLHDCDGDVPGYLRRIDLGAAA